MTATLSASHNISPILSGAARRFAVHAIDSEAEFLQSLPLPDNETLIALHTVMQYTSGAVIMAVADVECTINESFEGADGLCRRLSPKLLGGDPTRPSDLTLVAAERWKESWPDVRRQKLNAMEKVNKALELADLEPINTGEGVGQNMCSLIMLRNELVHNAPVARRHGGPLALRDKLEQRVINIFEPSTLVPDTYPYFWFRCLSAGCARWAYTTATDITNDFLSRLGIPISIEPNLP